MTTIPDICPNAHWMLFRIISDMFQTGYYICLYVAQSGDPPPVISFEGATGWWQRRGSRHPSGASRSKGAGRPTWLWKIAIEIVSFPSENVDFPLLPCCTRG